MVPSRAIRLVRFTGTAIIVAVIAFGAMLLVLRFIGSLFLLGAIIALTSDVSRSRRPGTPAFTSIYKHWSDVAPQTLAATQKTVASRTHAIVWDPMIRSVLSIPAFVTFGGLAVVCLYFGRRRRRVEIFVN